MNNSFRKGFVLVLASLFAFAPAFEVAQADGGGKFRRLAANFRGFEGIGSELATILPPSGVPPGSGGQVIYEKSIHVSEDYNVLFITVSGSANVHDGARLLLACIIDGEACNPGQVPAGSPAGWIPLQRFENYNLYYALLGAPFVGDGLGGAGDLHLNGVNYTWCTPIKKQEDDGDDDDDDGEDDSTHTIKIKIASTNVNGTVLPLVDMEGTHFYIDAAKLKKKNACKVETTPVIPPAF